MKIHPCRSSDRTLFRSRPVNRAPSVGAHVVPPLRLSGGEEVRRHSTAGRGGPTSALCGHTHNTTEYKYARLRGASQSGNIAASQPADPRFSQSGYLRECAQAVCNTSTTHRTHSNGHSTHNSLLLLQNVRLKSNQLQTKRPIVPCLCTSLAGRSPSPVPRPSSSLLSLSPSSTASAARRPSPSLSVVPVRLSPPVRPSRLS